MGIDPTNKGFADLCLTSRAPPRPPQARKAWKRSGLEFVAWAGRLRHARQARACCVGIVGLFRGLENLIFE